MYISGKNIKIILIFTITSFNKINCQIYEDDCIFYTDSRIKSWATKCYIQRGYVDISDKSKGKVSYGYEENATGVADNNVISLGDSGIAICKFKKPIVNGNGYDFAVFENAFNDSFLELAHVEVSTDSIHWYRFSSVSLTPTNFQIPTFGSLDYRNIKNLAGKCRAFYGTMFDLEDLDNSTFLNKNQINYIKVIDVIGCINCPSKSYDSKGNIINDPYPTPFETGGFDLDAIAVINEGTENSIYCTITNKTLYLNSYSDVSIFNFSGQKVANLSNVKEVFLNYASGIYIIKVIQHDKALTYKICLY